MTPEQIEQAADALATTTPGNGLPPMAVEDILTSITEDIRVVNADLWTCRDALDAAEARGRITEGQHTAAVADLAALAEHLGAALDAGRRIAARTGAAVPMDTPDADPW